MEGLGLELKSSGPQSSILTTRLWSLLLLVALPQSLKYSSPIDPTPQLLMLLAESTWKQNPHSVVDKTMGLGADSPMFKPLAKQQLFFPLFASIHLIGRLQGHGTFGLQCSTFFCCQHIPHTSIQLCQPSSLVSWPQNSLKMRPDAAHAGCKVTAHLDYSARPFFAANTSFRLRFNFVSHRHWSLGLKTASK